MGLCCGRCERTGNDDGFMVRTWSVLCKLQSTVSDISAFFTENMNISKNVI